MKRTPKENYAILSRLCVTTTLLLAGLVGTTAAGQDSKVSGDTENATCPLVPSTTKPAGLAVIPRSQEFIPQSQRAGLSQKRIALFGDLFAMNKDTPPKVSDELRTILARADLVLGNIEAPITYNNGALELGGNQFFNFHANVAYLKSAMAQYCIDPAKAVFTVANNHAGDNGSSSMSRWEDTLTYASHLGATIVGIDSSNVPAPAIAVKESGDLRVGVVGWTHVQNNAPAKEANSQIHYPTWEASLRVTSRSDWAQRKRDLGLDMLIGLPHWDCQLNRYPQPYTVRTTDTLHDNGFDLIAGAHQDSIQPAKRFVGEDNDMAFYGLGNLTNAINLGNNILLNVVELVVDGTGRVLEYTVHPFVMHWVALSGRPNLPSFNLCAGRAVYDFGRRTDWEVVTLDWLATSTASDRKDFATFGAHLDAVFPR
ncbi:MAG: hypothetical protein RLZZ450_4444 [Pseudomonadota bacterium]|jgi:hypothetical protein